MTNIDDFLESLDKYEISFLYKYKYDEYMKDTQTKIKATLQKFQLTDYQREKLIKEKIEEPFEAEFHQQCVRCKSKKMYAFQVEISPGRYSATMYDAEAYSGKMKTTKITRCAICGFNPAEGLPKSVKINSPGIKYDRRKKRNMVIIIAVVFLLYILLMLLIKE